jgi:Carboxypeptidase regulatory-like domain/Putative zinc-finger
VNQNLRPGMHPDADQLSIFVEGAATRREREQMLAHLAECGECRDAVFLMQRPVEAPAAASEGSTEWVWQRWLLPVGLTGALLACGLMAMLIYVRPRTAVPGSVRQNAEVPGPGIGVSGKTFAPSVNAGPGMQHERIKSGSGRGAVAMNAVRQEAAAGSKAPNAKSHPAAAGAATQQTETGLSSGSVVVSAGAAPDLKTDTPPGLDSVVVQQMPRNGRNVASLQPLAAPPGAQTANPQDSSEAQRALPALRVERPSGQDGTLSGVSGRVTDASGAVIPKATVALSDAAGTTRQTATGADGSFQLTGMPAGRYDLTVTAPGFTKNQQSIDLKPSELAMLQPVLNIGTVTETVEVMSGAPSAGTESTSVSAIAARLPSRLPVAASVSVGKRILTLDSGGSLFLSRNAGKSWKQVKPQWTGKPIRIYLATAEGTAAKPKSKLSAPNSAQRVFQLTTDTGAEWTSKDGTHWRQQ